MAAAAMVPVNARVVHRERETADVVTLALDVGGERYPFAPGQFTMLHLPGIGEVPLSITGDPRDDRYLVHTVRDVGRVTAAVCDLQEGDNVGIRGPFGSAWPMREAVGFDVLVLAGGLGLAPVRPIIYHVMNNRKDYGSANLLYGTRTPDDIFYQRDLADWRASFSLTVPVTVDVANAEWRGRVGVVTRLLDVASFMPDETFAFLCGPEIMMRLSAEQLLQRGIPASQIYLSLERNMQCAIGLCGHCQLGNALVCRDGPVVPLPRIQSWLGYKEI